MIPKPPPMSWLENCMWSMPTPIAGPMNIAANIGIWLLERNSITPVPGSQLTSAPVVSSGVDEKRWKCRRSIRTTWSAFSSAQSTSP